MFFFKKAREKEKKMLLVLRGQSHSSIPITIGQINLSENETLDILSVNEDEGCCVKLTIRDNDFEERKASLLFARSEQRSKRKRTFWISKERSKRQKK